MKINLINGRDRFVSHSGLESWRCWRKTAGVDRQSSKSRNWGRTSVGDDSRIFDFYKADIAVSSSLLSQMTEE